ncbi:hypothetical protein DZF93_14210, partial [Clavibacter michiganensis subsp. insidiosus]
MQAGAMQVGATDERSREVARAIRGLSTVTLEELRGMVEVLRAAGGERSTSTMPRSSSSVT